MTTSYSPAQPGTWLLAVTGGTVLFIEGAASSLIGELWTALGAADPVQATLDILTRGGLSSAPSFALGHVVDGSLHALVRGPLVLSASAAEGQQSIDGTGVSTWRETNVPGLTSLSAGDSTTGLPIGSGVVWASAFTFEPGAAAIATPTTPVAVAEAAAPAPAPAPAPVPVPVQTAVPEQQAAPTAERDLPAEHTIVEHTITETVEEQPALITPPPVDNTYSHLFEETVHRSIEDAAIREEEPTEEEPTATTPAEVLGDHDGETVMSADVAALRARKKAAAAASTPAPEARSIYLELPNDQRESLSQPVIIGRSPSVSQVSGTELPRLVSIPGSQDISRSHARFAVEGGTVVVTDLHSRNGTTIALPGKAPQLLRKGEPTAVLPGTVVDLGGVVTLTVREA